MLKKLLLATFVVVASFAATGGNAFAAGDSSPSRLSRVINDGLTDDPSTATARTRQLLETDAAVLQAVASDMRVPASSVQIGTAQAVSQTRCELGRDCLNTGKDGNGNIRTTSQRGVVVVAWKFRVRAEGQWRTFIMKGNCANPLLRRQYRPAPPKAVVLKKQIALRIDRVYRGKTRTIICPSGQSVQVTPSSRVRGIVRGWLWAEVYGKAKLKIRQALDLVVQNQVVVKCGPADAALKLVKLAYLDGKPVELKGGEFEFQVFVGDKPIAYSSGTFMFGT